MILLLCLQNHVVERFWPEVNRMVNYPLKTFLNQLCQQDEIDMDDDQDKYVVSQLAVLLTSIGRERFVGAWNHKQIGSK